MLGIIVAALIPELIVATLLFVTNSWTLYGLGVLALIVAVIGSGTKLIPVSINIQNLLIAMLLVWVEVFFAGVQWRARTRQSSQKVVAGFIVTALFGVFILVYLIVVFTPVHHT